MLAQTDLPRRDSTKLAGAGEDCILSSGHVDPGLAFAYHHPGLGLQQESLVKDARKAFARGQ